MAMMGWNQSGTPGGMPKSSGPVMERAGVVGAVAGPNCKSGLLVKVNVVVG
jgi:hypothetical protein